MSVDLYGRTVTQLCSNALRHWDTDPLITEVSHFDTGHPSPHRTVPIPIKIRNNNADIRY